MRVAGTASIVTKSTAYSSNQLRSFNMHSFIACDSVAMLESDSLQFGYNFVSFPSPSLTRSLLFPAASCKERQKR